jgi:predicted transposase YdaD
MLLEGDNINAKALTQRNPLRVTSQVYWVYLDELAPDETIGVGLIQLILAGPSSAVSQAQALMVKTRRQGQTTNKNAAIIGLIETILSVQVPSTESRGDRAYVWTK